MAYREMQFDRKTAKVARYYDRVKGGAMGVPVSLQVALCDACFNRCIMCDHPSRVPHRMDVNSWIEKLYWFAARGVESVCYSGGDPMAYSDFNAVMKAHIDLNVEFGMTITGYAPPTIDLDLLARAKWVRVSLDAITPEVYAKVRGKVPVAKVLKSVEAMLAAHVPVGLGITLHADNTDDLPHVLAWAREKGITDIETHHLQPVSAPRAVRVPDAWFRKIEPFQNCHAVMYQLYIDAQGDVYPCCMTAGDALAEPQAFALGNLWNDDWENVIWPATIRYSQLVYADLPPVCKDCIQRLSQINSVCGALQAMSEKEFF